jgi:two-component sensor histidine kinase
MMPRFLSDLSIRGKLIAIVMISSSLALLLVGIAFVVYDYSSSKNALFQSMETLTAVIGNNCTAALQFDSQNDAKSTLAGLKAERQVVLASVYSRNGNIFATYPEDSAPSSTTLSASELSGQYLEAGLLVTIRPIVLDAEVIGHIVLRTELRELQDRLSRDIMMVGLLVLLASLFALLVVSRLQRVISNPILNLASIAENVSKDKDYSVRAKRFGSDEVGFLVDSFNDMLDQVHRRDLELLEVRDGLELRVKERTAELESEIAERVLAQERITASLREKEVLLKEVHHRVKNNLQIITSLLNLQASKIKDKKLEAMFRDSQGRVKTMALIHEKLYRSENLSEVNFSDYVDSLTRYMLSTISGNRERITVKQDIDDILLGVDIAIPCGLIINELVTNSLKYAFPDGKGGEIAVSCKKRCDGRISLTVGDNGVGIANHVDIENSETLGMQLVNSLIGQLDGTMRIERERGTRFTLEFGYEQREKEARQHAVA